MKRALFFRRIPLLCIYLLFSELRCVGGETVFCPKVIMHFFQPSEYLKEIYQDRITGRNGHISFLKRTLEKVPSGELREEIKRQLESYNNGEGFVGSIANWEKVIARDIYDEEGNYVCRVFLCQDVESKIDAVILIYGLDSPSSLRFVRSLLRSINLEELDTSQLREPLYDKEGKITASKIFEDFTDAGFISQGGIED